MAAWQVMPPPSVTRAAARRMVGTQSGLVMGATRISPVTSCSPSRGSASTRTSPLARPAEAASPLTRTRAAASAPVVPAGSAAVPRVVIGRDWTSTARPSAIAHSVSWGQP